ncbi:MULTISPECIES: hypothetical protein [Pantoea]|nr:MULTISPECIES: hypothetical protein [Pantoea]
MADQPGLCPAGRQVLIRRLVHAVDHHGLLQGFHDGILPASQGL